MKSPKLVILIILAVSFTSCSKDTKGALKFRDNLISVTEQHNNLGNEFYSKLTQVVIGFMQNEEYPNKSTLDNLDTYPDSLISSHTAVMAALDTAHEFDEEIGLLKINKEYYQACHQSFLVSQKTIDMFKANMDKEKIVGFFQGEFTKILEAQKELENKKKVIEKEYDSNYGIY